MTLLERIVDRETLEAAVRTSATAGERELFQRALVIFNAKVDISAIDAWRQARQGLTLQSLLIITTARVKTPTSSGVDRGERRDV